MALEARAGRWRRHNGTDPDGPALAFEPAAAAPRQYSVTFHVMARSTLATVIETDWQGHRRWDRRIGTMVLSSGADTLRGQLLADALRSLLREALENLS